MKPRVRPFEQSDYPGYKSIHDAIYPMHPLGLEASKHEDWWFGRTRFIMRRYVVEVSANVAAVGSFFHEVFSYKPNAYCLRLEVHPKSQRQGVGTLLFEKLLGELRIMRAERLWAPFIPPNTPSSEFAETKGFAQTRFELESVLDLQHFNSGRVGPALSRIKECGIEVKNLASELASDSQAGRRLYELEMQAGDDVPRLVESEDITYEEYSMVILQNPTYLTTGSFVAKLGGEYVGSSSLWRAGPRGYLTQGFTGVRREHRKTGVATALKLMVAKAASDRKAKYLRTSNDSANERMLKLNGKLGFERTQKWAIYERRLS